MKRCAFFVVLVAVLAASVLSACSKTDPIVGTWVCYSGTQYERTMTFKKNGSVVDSDGEIDRWKYIEEDDEYRVYYNDSNTYMTFIMNPTDPNRMGSYMTTYFRQTT